MFLIYCVSRLQQKVCPRSGVGGGTSSSSGGGERRGPPERLCARMLLEYALSFLCFPVLGVWLFIKFLLKHWGRETPN